MRDDAKFGYEGNYPAKKAAPSYFRSPKETCFGKQSAIKNPVGSNSLSLDSHSVSKLKESRAR